MSVPVSFASSRISGNRASHEFHLLGSCSPFFLVLLLVLPVPELLSLPPLVSLSLRGAAAQSRWKCRGAQLMWKSFSHQCGGRNWSTCVSSQGTVLCHHFVNSVLEFCEDGAASPLPPAHSAPELSSSGALQEQFPRIGAV